jgi:hypothetical protein
MLERGVSRDPYNGQGWQSGFRNDIARCFTCKTALFEFVIPMLDSTLAKQCFTS